MFHQPETSILAKFPLKLVRLAHVDVLCKVPTYKSPNTIVTSVPNKNPGRKKS